MLLSGTASDLTVRRPTYTRPTTAIHFRKLLQKLPEYRKSFPHFWYILEEVIETLFV
jgi:hypothetical protein